MYRSATAIMGFIVMAAATPASAAQAEGTEAKQPDPIQVLVGRLDLEKYKATIKGLTRFGDRRQGTERNRAAVDWIEAQLKRYGCADICADQVSVFSHRNPQAQRTANLSRCGAGRRPLPRPARPYRRQYRPFAANGREAARVELAAD